MDLELNVKRLNDFLDTYIPLERRSKIREMYEDLGDKLYLAPASSTESFHNAFPGGYLDHILRVTDFAVDTYNFWKSHGMEVSDFEIENVVFVGLHHDLGKLGFPGKSNENYIPNDSEWHRNKLGQVYKVNDANPFMLIQDQSLYLLQHYGIPVEWVEFLAIKIHDGLYDDVNKPYFISRTDQAKIRTNLPHILHHADYMAARYEYEQWKKNSTPKKESPIVKSSSKKNSNFEKLGNLAAKANNQDSNLNDTFKKIFG